VPHSHRLLLCDLPPRKNNKHRLIKFLPPPLLKISYLLWRCKAFDSVPLSKYSLLEWGHIWHTSVFLYFKQFPVVNDGFICTKHTFPFLSAKTLNSLVYFFIFVPFSPLVILSFPSYVKFCSILPSQLSQTPTKAVTSAHFGYCTLIGRDHCHADHGHQPWSFDWTGSITCRSLCSWAHLAHPLSLSICWWPTQPLSLYLMVAHPSLWMVATSIC
jgi:hypothetical protein